MHVWYYTFWVLLKSQSRKIRTIVGQSFFILYKKQMIRSINFPKRHYLLSMKGWDSQFSLARHTLIKNWLCNICIYVSTFDWRKTYYLTDIYLRRPRLYELKWQMVVRNREKLTTNLWEMDFWCAKLFWSGVYWCKEVNFEL